MDRSEVQKGYFKWLCALVNMPENYSILAEKLRRTNFVWIVERDENRAEDGKQCRYAYILSQNFDEKSAEKAKEFLDGPCSVMEFLVALAHRIETDIMAELDSDDQTSAWFWEMISNLELSKFDNKHYDENRVDYILNRFMGRKYGENGVGNVFKNYEKPGPESGPLFRNLEIWAQLQQFLSHKIGF